MTLLVILLIPAELRSTLNAFSELYCVVLILLPFGITIRELNSVGVPDAFGTKTFNVSKSFAPNLNPSNTFSGGESIFV